MKVIPETRHANLITYLRFYCAINFTTKDIHNALLIISAQFNSHKKCNLSIFANVVYKLKNNENLMNLKT